MELLNLIFSEIDKPFIYSKTFHGKGHYSQDGQLWGVDSIEITKSKTAITVTLKRGQDVWEFSKVCFIRSIEELKNQLSILAEKHSDFFNQFGTVTIYP